MENYNECYHCGGLHPELCEIVQNLSKREAPTLPGMTGFHIVRAYTFTKTGKQVAHPFPD